MKTHGLSKTFEFRVWQGIKQRCYVVGSTSYKNYGARGIRMCDRWRNSFVDFLDDIGRAPSELHSIERCHNDGNYEPANCWWATRVEQALNRRTNVRVTYKGEEKVLSVWCKELRLPYSVVQRRLKDCGWPVDRAFEAPLRGTEPRRQITWPT